PAGGCRGARRRLGGCPRGWRRCRTRRRSGGGRGAWSGTRRGRGGGGRILSRPALLGGRQRRVEGEQWEAGDRSFLPTPARDPGPVSVQPGLVRRFPLPEVQVDRTRANDDL